MIVPLRLKPLLWNLIVTFLNPLKQAIFLEASHKKSESDIARELNVSHSTVNRIIHTSYEEHSLHFNSLPKVLCFDEFKSVKSAEGASVIHFL